MTVGGIFGHHLVDDGAERRREIGPNGGERRRFVTGVFHGHLEGGGAVERRSAGQHEVGRDAEGVDVGAAVERLALDLFGTHVQRRSHGDAALGEVKGLRIAEAARQAEVGHLNFAFAGQQNVFRLDVAVDDSGLGGPLQGGGRLSHDAQGEEQFRRPFFGDELAEIAALDVFEGHVGEAVDVADGVDLNDVGVVDLGDGLGLGLEALERRGVDGEVGAQDLEGHLTLE